MNVANRRNYIQACVVNTMPIGSLSHLEDDTVSLHYTKLHHHAIITRMISLLWSKRINCLRLVFYQETTWDHFSEGHGPISPNILLYRPQLISHRHVYTLSAYQRNIRLVIASLATVKRQFTAAIRRSEACVVIALYHWLLIVWSDVCV